MRVSSRSSVRLIDPADLEPTLPDMPLTLSDDALIPIALIDSAPNHPRETLPDLEDLAGNISRVGLLQPIAVRKLGPRYEVIGGHRRVAAYKLLLERNPHDPQWRSIPAVVRRCDDETSFCAGLSMEVHTAPWSAEEEAAALQHMTDAGWTLKRIGEALSKTESWVSKRRRAYADEALAPYVMSDGLAITSLEELLSVRDPAERHALADQAAREHWSPKQARVAARTRLQPAPSLPTHAARQSDQVAALQRCAAALRRALTGIAARDLPPSVLEELDNVRARLDEVLLATDTQKEAA